MQLGAGSCYFEIFAWSLQYGLVPVVGRRYIVRHTIVKQSPWKFRNTSMRFCPPDIVYHRNIKGDTLLEQLIYFDARGGFCERMSLQPYSITKESYQKSSIWELIHLNEVLIMVEISRFV
jgi:hypothetical protein